MPSTRASVRGRCEFYDPQQRQGYLSVAGWAPDVHVLFRAEDVLGPPPAAGSAVLCELEQPRPGLVVARRLTLHAAAPAPAPAVGERHLLHTAALHEAARVCLSWMKGRASRLAGTARLPAYVDSPKQALQDLFRAEQRVPAYNVRQWAHCAPSTFSAVVAAPWLLPPEACSCDASIRARDAERACPDPTLWTQLLSPAELSADVDPSARCFCRAAFGFGVGHTRKDAERLAAAYVCLRLHSCGLLPGLSAHTATSTAPSDHSSERWYVGDPKGAIVNFAAQHSLDFRLSVAEQVCDARPLSLSLSLSLSLVLSRRPDFALTLGRATLSSRH